MKEYAGIVQGGTTARQTVKDAVIATVLIFAVVVSRTTDAVMTLFIRHCLISFVETSKSEHLSLLLRCKIESRGVNNG